MKEKKIKKKLQKLEKALRRYDWEPGENQVKFHLNDFDEVIERYMDLFEEVSEEHEIYSKQLEIWG